MNQKIIISIIAVLVIGGAIVWYVSSNKAVAPETKMDTTQNNTNQAELPPGEVPGDDPATNPTIPTSDTIAVSTQVPGSSATIDNVFLSKPGFVTIHEATSKGQPGNIVGTSGLLGVGAKQDLEINAPLKPGAKYIAMVRMDNGDKKFNAGQDTAVMKNDLPLMILFSVSK